MQTYNEKFDLIRNQILEQIELSREMEDSEVYEMIDRGILREGKKQYGRTNLRGGRSGVLGSDPQ